MSQPGTRQCDRCGKTTNTTTLYAAGSMPVEQAKWYCAECMAIQERKKAFIAYLARFLSDQLASKSIQLQMEEQSFAAKSGAARVMREWAHLRNMSGVQGYANVAETVVALEELLK